MIERVHFITPDRPSDYHVGVVEKACWGGVRWVQLRVKGREFNEWCALAEEVRGVCRNYGAIFVVNDSPDVAAAVGADGVHVGDADTSPTKAREILGAGKIIGATANTPARAVEHAAAGVNYIGVGPYRFTSTKHDLKPVLGSTGVAAITQALRAAGFQTPVIVVGGVVAEDAEAIRGAGAHGVAVSGGIAAAHDVMAAARGFVDLWSGE
jgi:thiamine-phosphate pyrophosphorylase